MLKQHYLCGVLAALSGAPALFAQTKPTLWVQTNGTIGTNATSNCDVIKMITATTNLGVDRSGNEAARYQSAYDDGVATADDACNEILGRANPSERVAIHFYAFGYGGRYGDPGDGLANGYDPAPTMGFHVDDRLSPTCGSGPYFQMTPWLDHSKAECIAWMKGFCKQYRTRQIADPTIPNPEHFSYDFELGIGVGAFNDVPMWAAYADCLLSDDRSGANSAVKDKWRYLPLGLGEGKTLAQSYREAGRRFDGQGSDTTLPLSSGNPNPSAISSASPYVQQLFISWFNGVYSTAYADVLDAAARPVAAAYFPGCTFGNFNYATTDGQSDASLPPYEDNSPFDDRLFDYNPSVPIFGTSGYRLLYDTLTGWNNFAQNTAGAVDSPAFYNLLPEAGFVDISESILDQFFVFMRGQLDAINFSWDGTRRHNVIPWIYGKPNMETAVYDEWGLSTVIDDNWYRDVFAVGRCKGVKDYLYFQPGDSISNGDKAAIDTVMGDVWKTSPGCATADIGTITSSGTALEVLSESDAVTLDVASTTFGGTQVAACTVRFKIKSGFNPAKLKIVVEAHTTYNDNSVPTVAHEIDLAARPYDVANNTNWGPDFVAINASTVSPTIGSVVLDPAADFIVPANSGGVCSANGEQEFWIWIGSQTHGGFTPKAFTLHIDNIQVYGYD